MTFLRTLVCDHATPVAVYARMLAEAPKSSSFLLESAVAGETWGRYSIIGWMPMCELAAYRAGWKSWGEHAAKITDVGDPLSTLAPLILHPSAPSPKAPLPKGGDASKQSMAERMANAHIGYFAWDLVHKIDKVPAGDARVWDAHEIPMIRLVARPTICLFDNVMQTVTVASASREHFEATLRLLGDTRPAPPIAVPQRGLIDSDVVVDLSDADYMDRVRKAQAYIAAGDAFQIVLARTFSVPRRGATAFDAYRRMRVLNPSPYLYFLRLADPSDPNAEPLEIAGASPEVMVRLQNHRVTVRPLAGTRPRGETPEEDEKLAQELLADPKERAEHVMLIDLGRNDIGRIAKTGTVRLTKQMVIERYSHVMHIVSEVHGEVDPATHPLEVLRATFPAGTLSGAPKIRAMQIIRELEARPRNIYGGAIGYVGADGNMDLAIAIRTLTAKGDHFEVTAGAGIVEASNPQAEADETRNKARGVLAAIAATR